MELAALAVALGALAVAALALARAGRLAQAVEDARADARRVGRNVAEEAEERLGVVRRLVARLHAGEPLTREMILEGQLWRDVSTAEGRALVEGGSAHVLDVRTARETAAGILPGARWIPADELEERHRELPRDGRPILVYCAVGSRSAAACEWLSARGYDGLLNLTGGFQSWTGPTAKLE